ncbi:MAG: hypothetical protein IKG42_01125 [Clostridia bacterium]|nr:hypothetical protein [Clostridia bacterium]
MKLKAFFAVLKKRFNINSFLKRITLVLILYFAISGGIQAFNYLKGNTYPEEDYRSFQQMAQELQIAYDKSDYSIDGYDTKIVISTPDKNDIEYNFLTQSMTTLHAANGIKFDNLGLVLLTSLIMGIVGWCIGNVIGIIVNLVILIFKGLKKKIDNFKEEMNQEIQKM